MYENHDTRSPFWFNLHEKLQENYASHLCLFSYFMMSTFIGFTHHCPSPWYFGLCVFAVCPLWFSLLCKHRFIPSTWSNYSLGRCSPPPPPPPPQSLLGTHFSLSHFRKVNDNALHFIGHWWLTWCSSIYLSACVSCTNRKSITQRQNMCCIMQMLSDPCNSQENGWRAILIYYPPPNICVLRLPGHNMAFGLWINN